MSSLCIWGTSITWGAFDTEKGGWVNRLRLHFDINDIYLDVYNLGITGETSAGILERFETEAKAREPEIIVFDVGINDAAYIQAENRHQIEKEQFESNLKLLVKKAKKFTGNIFLIVPKGVDESKTNPIPWHPELSYLNKDIAQYADVVRKVSKEAGATCVEIGELKADDLYDGLHPNARGHEKIFQEIKKFLEKEKILPSPNS
ncbi:MAG: GDSL-type esterase/lipase family protein [bacterium]|nr:GDSL-type esterase/lipase family protein [bacterium]